MKPIAPLLALTLVIAGCLGSGSSTTEVTTPEGTATDDPSLPPTFGAGEGAVRGRILDDEYLPIAGASVTLVEHGRKSRTQDDGRFLFNHVPTGTVTLVAEAQGHEPGAARVLVREGLVEETAMTLVAIPPEDVPYHVVLDAWHGYISCSAGFWTFTTADFCGAVDNSNSTFAFTFGEGLSAIQTEVVWDPTTSLAAKRLGLTYTQPGIGPTYSKYSTGCNVDGSTPAVRLCHLSDNVTLNPFWDDIKTWARVEVRATGNGSLPPPTSPLNFDYVNWTQGHAGPVIQQHFFTYFTLFHWNKAVPEGYKARPDA
jgi:hypothetical protein